MDELVDAGAALGVLPDDPGALAQAIVGPLAGPGLAAISGAGRAFAQSRHTADAMAAAHQALYEEMLHHG
jgi:glycosyltransferase involved in cell wall biosynthesis